MHKKQHIQNQTVFTVRDGRHTIAFGMYEDQTRVVPFAGVASKCPTDKENPERGQRLAVGAAFRNLGRQILKAEWEQIKAQYTPQRPIKKCSIEAPTMARVVMTLDDGTVILDYKEPVHADELAALKKCN
jgi:hypothetical protein